MTFYELCQVEESEWSQPVHSIDGKISFLPSGGVIPVILGVADASYSYDCDGYVIPPDVTTS